jgi:hypothetical protein
MDGVLADFDQEFQHRCDNAHLRICVRFLLLLAIGYLPVQPRKNMLLSSARV